MGVIERITDRCVVLNFGRKIAEGPYREVAADRAGAGSLSRGGMMSDMLEIDDVYTAYDKADVLRRRLARRSSPAASPACSAPTAPARPR